MNKSKSSAIVSPDDDANNTGDDSDSKYGTGRSRYLALKERRNLLARSRSSHLFGVDDDDALDDPVSPTTASPTAYLASRFDTNSHKTKHFIKINIPVKQKYVKIERRWHWRIIKNGAPPAENILENTIRGR